MIEKIPDMRPIRAITKATGLSYDCIRKWCLTGKIVHVRIGNGKFLVNFDKLIEFLNTSRGEPDDASDR